MALVDRDSQHLIQNISDDSDRLNAISSSAKDVQENSRKEADQGFAKEVSNIYSRFMRQNNLNQENGLPKGSDREASYLKELDSNKKVKEKSARKKQNKRDSFYG